MNHTRLSLPIWFDYDRTMKDGPNIVGIAALIGDHARAEILTALMGGHALTATELAQVAGVTKQTVSTHLAKLLDAQLLAVQNQGRHRYFRLAQPDVAQLLESLMGVAYRVGAVRVRSSPREPALRKARVCYDHLAGELGVLVYDGLAQRRLLRTRDEALELTPAGSVSAATSGSTSTHLQAIGGRYAARVSTGACAAIISPVRSALRFSTAAWHSAGRVARRTRGSSRFPRLASVRCVSALQTAFDNMVRPIAMTRTA